MALLEAWRAKAKDTPLSLGHDSAPWRWYKRIRALAQLIEVLKRKTLASMRVGVGISACPVLIIYYKRGQKENP